MPHRLEQGKSRGYHCHLLIIYNGSLHRNDGYLGQEIGSYGKRRLPMERVSFTTVIE